MAHQPRDYELVLFGATGYTGKLVAEWISTHLPEDLEWAIAGRNVKKLQAVVDDLKKLNPQRKSPSIKTCDLEEEQLNYLAQTTKLLISTVGPFMHYGEPVIAACARNGTHYLDSTGESPWLYDMIAKYDALARRNNAVLIPECGLDSVPADIMAYVLARAVRKKYGVGCEQVLNTAYAVKSGFSGGTLLTIVDMFATYSLQHLAESTHPYALSPIKPQNPPPSPKGNLFQRLLNVVSIPELGGLQTTYLMAGVDTCIVHRSWGLFQQASASDSAISYGKTFRFNEYMRTTSFFFGAFFNIALGIGSLLFAFPPTRWLLSPLIKKYVITQPGEGPSRESMKNDFMSFRGIGIAEDGKGKVAGKLHIAHGGYAATALTLSAAAQLILRGRFDDTPAGKAGGGILTPAMLGDEYVKTLGDFGMSISTDA